MHQALGFSLAAVIGLALGALGGGGSILTVPVLVFVMGFSPKVAIAMSLPVVGATSLVGALRHWRSGSFDVRLALAFGAVAMVGALAAARAASLVPGVVQLTMLGLVMLAAAAMMLRGSREAAAPVQGAEPAERRPWLIAVTGLGVGTLTGLVGVGGGFLFVPALVLLAAVPMKTAIGTSLLVIAMNTAAAFVGYRGQVEIPWLVVAAFTTVAIAGTIAGTRLVRFIPQRTLRRAFAYFLFVMAAFILYQNRAVLAHPRSAFRPSNAGAAAR
jgi:uncharacterized protein